MASKKTPSDPQPTSASSDFEQLASEDSPGLLREFWDFLRYNKKWWLAPMIVVLLLIGLIIWASTTAVAPFIYTMF